MSSRKKQEDTFIDQILYPKLEDIGIPRIQLKRNVSTAKSGMKRGDLWVSTSDYNHPDFEKNIIALIECKDTSAQIDDKDWIDAKTQGQYKANRQGLKAYFVTNTINQTRCYNTVNQGEVLLDSAIISEIPPIPILHAIQTQVSEDNSNVIVSSFAKSVLDPKEFRSSLWNLRQVFRSCGISKGSEDSMIKTALTFAILKLITEQQMLQRTLPDTIALWNDWRDGHLDREIGDTIEDIVLISEYTHLKGCLYVDKRLDAISCVKVKVEFSKYKFYGSDFDIFGLIYESLANKEIKKDFGEFYTPRHIIRTIVKLRLRDERKPRPITICDPACGTGGFLVESFLFLQRSYEKSKSLDNTVVDNLRQRTFYGFDTNDTVAIPFARTNMLMADDGGINIKVTADSLIDLPQDSYDYVLANVPYGKYDGKADMTTFSFTNNRRLELLFIEKIVTSLKPGGKAAVIVPDGLIESTSNSGFRQKLLCEVDMEAVVSLPHFVFEPYTTEKTYVLFFKKKQPSTWGRLQTEPIYLFIVDKDGFQDGKKRYPILENDFPLLESAFLSQVIPYKAGFVDIKGVSNKTYFSLCCEYYLRKESPIDVSKTEFESILKNVESLLSEISKGL